jgi:hypothetical protein
MSELPYYKKLISLCMMLVGTFLIAEHIWTYGRTDMFDVIGHEYCGLGLIVIAFVIMLDWTQWKKLKLWKIRNWFR